jgi:hypothetical protein
MASRICPKCGQEAPHTARFCPQCAAPFFSETTQTAPPTGSYQTAYQLPPRKNNTALFVGSGIAAVLILGAAAFAFVKASGLMHAAEVVAPPAAPIIQAPQQQVSAPPIVQAPNNNIAAPPIMQAANPQQPGPPQAILNYLEFVKQVEQQRTSLEAEEAAAILPLLGTAQGLKTDMDDDNSRQNGISQINQGMTSNLQKWQALIKEFNSVTPPTGCEELGNDYYKLLQDYTDLSSQIQVALANGDVAKVMGLQSAQTTVDLDASNADGAVTSICTKYNVKKTFVITTGSGSSGTSLLGG